MSVPAGSPSNTPVSEVSVPGVCVLGALRRGAYADSIALMQIAEDLRRLPGVESAALLMATPANLAQLAAADLLPAEAAGATGGRSSKAFPNQWFALRLRPAVDAAPVGARLAYPSTERFLCQRSGTWSTALDGAGGGRS